jgi:hypothetical protein
MKPVLAFAALVALVALALLAAGCGSDARSSGTAGVMWAVGDGGNGSDEARQVAARIAADRPARVLYLGDVYETGTAEEFRDNFAAVYGDLVRRMWPTPGNHEWPTHGQGYDPFWRSVTGRPTRHWYAYTFHGWRVISLNSETPDDPLQLRWLRRELGRRDDRCALAFWHRPRYSAGTEHGDQEDIAPLWNAVRGRVALVVNGHEHNLQRLRRIDGVVEVVSGGGGRFLHGVDESDERIAFARDDVFGALRLRLRPGLARLAFIGADGAVLDRSSVTC